MKGTVEGVGRTWIVSAARRRRRKDARACCARTRACMATTAARSLASAKLEEERGKEREGGSNWQMITAAMADRRNARRRTHVVSHAAMARVASRRRAGLFLTASHQTPSAILEK